MGTGKRQVWIPIVGVLAFLAIVVAIVVQLWVNRGPDFPFKEPAADFVLDNLDGQKVSLSDTDGKVRLVYFYYASCPDVCQPTTFMLSKVQNKLKDKNAFGNKTALYSITFDPERDTQEALTEFAQRFGADLSGWYFLRGEEAYTLEVAQQYGIYVKKHENGDITHANVFFLIDKHGNIRNHYYPSDYSLTEDEIVRDMLALTREK